MLGRQRRPSYESINKTLLKGSEMYCSKCGVQNSDGAAQCVNCGGVLMDTPQQAEVQPVPVAATDPKTSRLASTAFVMGLLSMTCILWPFLGLPAIVCGIIALVKIGNSKGQLKGTGLAVAGLVIPAVLTLVVPMVLAIMMPALSRTKKIAQRVVCATNLKGLSVAMMVYANDYDGTLPTENWCDLFVEEVDVSPKSFVCPDSDAIEGESCYAMNINIAGKNLDKLPANVVLFFETDIGLENGPRNTSIEDRRYTRHEFMEGCYDKNALVYKDRFNQFGGPEDFLIRHIDGCNIAFADGHIEFVTEDRIADLQWTVE
jgi:prepilin-type processing-associated H-X9-DG protein